MYGFIIAGTRSDYNTVHNFNKWYLSIIFYIIVNTYIYIYIYYVLYMYVRHIITFSLPCSSANGLRCSLINAILCCHSGFNVFGCTLVLNIFCPIHTLQYGSDLPFASAAIRLRARKTKNTTI